MPLIIFVPAIRREISCLAHGIIMQIFVYLGGALLIGSKALHQLQSNIALLLQNLGAFPGPRINDVGLGARKGRADNDLRAPQETCDVEMVAIEKPTPGRGRG